MGRSGMNAVGWQTLPRRSGVLALLALHRAATAGSARILSAVSQKEFIKARNFPEAPCAGDAPCANRSPSKFELMAAHFSGALFASKLTSKGGPRETPWEPEGTRRPPSRSRPLERDSEGPLEGSPHPNSLYTPSIVLIYPLYTQVVPTILPRSYQGPY